MLAAKTLKRREDGLKVRPRCGACQDQFARMIRVPDGVRLREAVIQPCRDLDFWPERTRHLRDNKVGLSPAAQTQKLHFCLTVMMTHSAAEAEQ